MIYEAVLLFGVVFVVAYVLLALFQWKYPLPPGPRALLQGLLFVAIGGYFVWCWTRSGQTLALKTWQLRVVGPDGRPPRPARAAARYLLAWHLWLPGLLYVWIFEARGLAAAAALLGGFAALLVPAFADARGRLLHDRWSGTRIVRL
jgi:uncharacterized RDD family membrane protein YckC